MEPFHSFAVRFMGLIGLMGRRLAPAMAMLPIAVSAAPEPRRVDVGASVELAVDIRGSGPIPVVFMHGYSLSRQTWDKVISRLPADRYTTYAYDLRGFGDSSKPESGHTMRQHAQDLAMLMDRLQLPHAVLIGHSLGGAIGQEFALRHPDRVLALVSSDAFARHVPLPGISDALRQRAASFGTPEQNRRILASAVPRYFDPRNASASDIDMFVGMTMQASTPALRDQLLDAYSAPTLDADQYRQLRIPVLAISGATDTVVPVANAIALGDIVPGSEIALVPRAGHTPMWERPDDWARQVLDFLDRRVSASP
ncbi:alpha/beta fold hydrolase [Bordetella sp. BOR01]|uniref:alpha/beta fold hydrolase n=1 Tax=Bordetella sp. BOR01 TaxID=2854779 RepID=UPI001C496C84|nr:alpha/beta hydrolase [Bordetella sp. BOR01]MBV7484645.1 alpha/beta hydrolase [Bordetella sp. BOR01]